MKKGSVELWIGGFVAVLLIGFFALYLTGYELPSWTLSGQIFENKKVVYPLYSSVCCEAKNFGDWDPANIENIKSYTQSYVCPDSTTQCRIREPQIQCPGISWFNPLATSPVWHVEVTNPGDINAKSYCNYLFCDSMPANGVEFSPSASVRYRGSCIDNALLINPANIVFLLTLLDGQVVSPTYGHLDVEFVKTELWKYPALEGPYAIPNTILCTKNAEIDTLIKKNPIEKDLVEKAKNLVEQEEGEDLDPSRVYEDQLSQSIFPMKPGQCYLTVDKWMDLPYWGNVNPLGEYKDEDVICSMSKGLIKIEQIGTQGGTTYFVPTERMEQPNLFCCSHGDCLAYGPNYKCIDYSCEKIPEGKNEGYCNSDLECQPQAGEFIDANCYKDKNTGKFYDWTGGCDRNSNTCKSPVTKEVACCPAYCSQWGQWCDKEKGCQEPIIDKPDCPAGFCCDGDTHKKQDCPDGEECCSTADPNVGICQESCEGLCLGENQSCDLSPTDCCPGLECSGGFLDLVGKTCQKPLADWSWIFIIILAVLGGFIGYFLGGYIGAAIGAIAGWLTGYLVYLWMGLAWWQQTLIGITGVAGGGLLIYVFGGAVATLIVVVAVAALRK